MLGAIGWGEIFERNAYAISPHKKFGPEVMAFVPPNLYVNWVKRSLNRLLSAELTIDGSPDATYRDAVKSFQSYEGISDDGIVGPITQNHLIRANRLVADYVRWVRKVLRGSVPLPALGSGGTMTQMDQAEIRRFQEYYGVLRPGRLKIDGWVGAQTEMVMIDVSGTWPPGDVKSSPTHYVFPDEPVSPSSGTTQPEENEIKALTWGLVRQKPDRISWDKVIALGGRFAIAVGGLVKGPSGVPSLDPITITKALGAVDAAQGEMAVMKGAAYAIMDHATGRKRVASDLETPDLFPGAIGGHHEEAAVAFKRGYEQMKTRLIHSKTRSTPALKLAFESLARARDRKLALRNIYEAMVEAFRNKGALRESRTLALHRWCSFEYPAIKVRCGPTPPR